MDAQGSKPAQNPMERELVITRVFNAPQDLVWRVWTEPEHVQQWWGPTSFTNPVCELDVRPGGAWRIVMRAPDGMEVVSSGVYQEVVPPSRLVFTNNALDSQGNRLLEGLTTVTLTGKDGTTTMTLHTRAVGLVPFAPMMLDHMEAGWNESLDSFTELLIRVKG